MPASGENSAGKPQVTIPGIVPLRVHGASPSFGTWLEARQEALDRPVLLKVLPPHCADTATAFGFEIEGLLHLAGEGVPLVIDEGKSAGVPYLIVEDADAVSMTPGSVSSAEDWRVLGEMLLSLEARICALGMLLLPVPFSALRRLPSGGFSLLELGWLVPFGASIPDLPQVPEALRSLEAAPGHSSVMLASTLSTIGEGLGGAPRSWRHAIALLDRDRGGDIDEARVRETLSEAQASSNRVPWLVAVSLIIAATLLLTWKERALEAPSPVASSAETEEEAREGVAGSQDETTETVDGGEETRWQAIPPEWVLPDGSLDVEIGAWELLQRIYGDDADPPLPLSRSVEDELAKIRDAFEAEGFFLPAQRASRMLEHHRWASLEAALSRWQPLREAAGAALARGDLAAAEAALVPAREELASRRPVTAVDGEVDALAERISAEGEEAFRRLKEDVARVSSAGSFLAAIASIDEATATLPARERGLSEELRGEILRRGVRHGLLEKSLQRSREASFNTFSLADFSGEQAIPIDLTVAIDGIEEFPDLAQRHRQWRRRFEVGEELLAAVGRALAARIASSEVSPYRLRDGAVIRARVEKVKARSVLLRLEGLRTEREVSLVHLSAATLEALFEEGSAGDSATDGGLLLFLLGDPEAALATLGDQRVASWQGDARAFLRRQRIAERDRSLARGGEKASSGDWAGARSDAIAIARSLPRDLVVPIEDELLGWCRNYWQEVGPGEAFPGAEVNWQRGRNLELLWDFSAGGDHSSWRALDDGSEAEIRAGVLLIRGSHRLRARGTPLPFADRLEVSWRAAYRDSTSPNLNLVLWVDEGGDRRQGLLAGVGYRPVGTASIGEDGDVVLLPANVLGPLAVAESGRLEGLAPPRIEPRVPVGTAVDIVVSSGPQGSELRIGGKTLVTLDPPQRRRGTIEIRTYDSTLLLATVRVRGTLEEEGWLRWLEERARKDLYRP